jgi:hypothetical protein
MCRARQGSQGVTVFKLTQPEPYGEPRDVLPFPSEAVREFGWGVRPARPRVKGHPDPAACDAAGRVERAMAEVERRFARLRLLIDPPENDRPKAA